MDPDLSLIEISREDDSLLQQMPNDDTCSVYSSSFSPLCTLRPPKPSPRALGLVDMEDSERPSSSSCKESVDKENVNLNKPEMPKLSIEPQPMKRKKKGGGYNLRKSLAWDKAFFTEEGVLDPIELSMISGNLNSLGGEKLSIIHEEGRESLLEVPEQLNDSTNIPALEEKLFKNLPVKATSGSKRAVGFSPQKHNGLAKNNGSATSSAKRRVLSAQDVNMSGSERNGCPRPTSSSSPVNVNTRKGATKELKVIRMPVAQTVSGLANPSAKSSFAGGHPKRTQPAPPEKNIRVRGSLSSRKTVASSAIPGPSSKSSTSKSTLPQPKRNAGRVVAKLSSSTHGKTASERLQDQVKPLNPHVSGGHCGDSSKMEVPLLQNSEKLDSHLPNVPIQAAKPSGLRMPSPSIRFFDQLPKSSASQNLAKKYIQPSNIPQPTSSISRNPYSVKIVQDIRPPFGHDRLRQLVSNSPSGSSNTAFPALTGHCSSSHDMLESDAGLYGMHKTGPKPRNCPIDDISNNQQNMQNIPSVVGKQDAEIVEPCEPNKQLPSDGENMKLNEDKSPLSMKTCGQQIKDEDEKDIDIPSESRDADIGRRAHIRANSHGGFMLQNEDISMANTEEPFMLSSETHSSFSQHSYSANASFSDYQNISTSANQTGASDELRKCVCAENADCISDNDEDNASKSEGSQVQDYSAGSKDGSRKSHVEDAENVVHDNNLTVSGPMEGNKFVASSEDVAGSFIEETDSLACQKMDHSLSATMETLIGSQDSYTDLHLRKDAQHCDKTNVLDKELLFMVNDCQSKAATTAAGFVNPRASLSGVVFSKWKSEADHSISLLASAVKDEDGPQKGDLTEHENLEENQFHPLVQKICQDISSPTFETYGQCSVETLTSNFKGEPSPNNKNMTIIQPQTVGSVVGDTDSYQTPVEGEYGDLADGEVDDANNTRQKMEFVQENISNSSFLSNSAAMDESVTASDLVEQLGDHPDLQDCSVVDDLPIDNGLSAQVDNSFHESHDKSLDNNGCESELAMRTKALGAELDRHLGPDVVDEKAGKHDVQNIYVMIHDCNESHVNTELEVGASLQMVDEKIIECPTVADGKETYPLSEAIHLESSRSYVEADLPLDHYTPNVQLQHHSESTSHLTGLKEGTLPQERFKDNQKANGLLINPPTYAPPFSDEWLAAIEAAGEEILTVKSGAVQHSPPDKTLPEPGPWSPVKRHNQGIGPFDCTKFTNNTATTNIPHSGSQ